MALIRVSYPSDPERRRVVFARAVALLARHGSYEGTPERGVFHGSTTLGHFAGSYRLLDGTGELEIEMTKKPLLISTHHVEKEIRKLLA